MMPEGEQGNAELTGKGPVWGGQGLWVRFKIGAGIVKPAGLRIRLRSGALQGRFVIHPAKKIKALPN